MRNDDFDINELIVTTLKPLGIPVYFTARKENNLPIVVFNVVGERGTEFWDDEEQVVKYKVTLNIFSKGNFMNYKKQIKKLMREAGFKRTDIPECIYLEDIEVFNQPLFFEYIEEKF